MSCGSRGGLGRRYLFRETIEAKGGESTVEVVERSEKSLREKKEIGGNIDCTWLKQEAAGKYGRFSGVGKKE